MLGWIADWAAAMRLAGTGRSAEAVDAARTAADAVDGFGERYTAARLLADLVPLLAPEHGGPLAEQATERLESMGARATAAALGGGGRT